MIGGEYSFGYLKPDNSTEEVHKDEDSFHEGNINIHTFNAYALFGLSHKLNLLMRFPLIIWHQNAEHEDIHHRTETIKGMSDISLGLRWLIRNEVFGPGQRLFAGVNLSFPTAKSYNMNPFSERADSVRHSHFALGDGHFSLDSKIEWWYRSEFPFVVGT
ncbi:MAG TPA: hypothetical protein ENN22_07925 [bacterium]|nr:hypothetical protein [bacterium]